MLARAGPPLIVTSDNINLTIDGSPSFLVFIPSIGLEPLYENDENFKSYVKQICGLSFLPLELVGDAWASLWEDAPYLC